MGGLAHYLEDEGVATTQISLIREHSEAMKPPRALWVPFELGRPLGAPSDAAFQRRVQRRAIDAGLSTGNNFFKGHVHRPYAPNAALVKRP